MLGTYSSGKIGFGVLLTARDAFSTNFNKFRKELSLTNAAAATFTKTLNRTASAFAGIGALALGGLGLGNLLKDAALVAGEYEQIEIAIKSIAGGELKGGKLIEDLRQFTLQSPLKFEDTVTNTKRLLAYGVSLKNIMPDIKMLTELSAGVGLDKFPFLALAYGQTQSMGKLMGQEVLQFANAGIGIIKEVAKLRGVDTGTLKAQMTAKQTSISAKEVRDALFAMTQEGGIFHNLVAKQMKSFKGMLSVLQDTFYFLKVEMGSVITSRYKSILAGMVQAAGKLVEFLGTDRGKATLLQFLKVFEVFAIGTLIATLAIATKFMVYLTGFLLPTAVRKTFMLAMANRQLGLSFSILFGSMMRGIGIFFNTILILSRIVALAYLLDRGFKSVFGSDYIMRFMAIMSALFEMMKNHNAWTGTTLMTNDTLKNLGQYDGATKTAVNLFVIFADIKRTVLGIGQGLELVFTKAFKIVQGIFRVFIRILKFFGLIGKERSEEIGTFSFLDNNALVNLGRIIGMAIGLKFVYKSVMMVVRGFKLLKTTLAAIMAFTKIGKALEKISRFGSMRYAGYRNRMLMSRRRSLFRALRDIRDVMFLRVARSIRKIGQAFSYATIKARIWGYVANFSMKRFIKNFLILPSLILLVIGLLYTLWNVLKSMDFKKMFAESWLGRRMGYDYGENIKKGYPESWGTGELLSVDKVNDVIPIEKQKTGGYNWLSGTERLQQHDLNVEVSPLIQLDGKDLMYKIKELQTKEEELDN